MKLNIQLLGEDDVLISQCRAESFEIAEQILLRYKEEQERTGWIQVDPTPENITALVANSHSAKQAERAFNRNSK